MVLRFPVDEGFFDLVERPFSLTPDPKYYFRSRAHGPAFDALSAALDRREGLLYLAGEFGLGKTTLCRTLVADRRAGLRNAVITNPLVSPEDLLRLLLQDLGAIGKEDVLCERLAVESQAHLHQRMVEFVERLRASHVAALVVIDEAHRLPVATAQALAALSAIEDTPDRSLQILLAGQPSDAGESRVMQAFERGMGTRARLRPLEQDECQRYVMHRLTIAGGGDAAAIAPRAIGVLHDYSRGVPRLVNLICARALEEAALACSHQIEPAMVQTAAAALQLVSARSTRRRWFGPAGH